MPKSKRERQKEDARRRSRAAGRAMARRRTRRVVIVVLMAVAIVIALAASFFEGGTTSTTTTTTSTTAPTTTTTTLPVADTLAQIASDKIAVKAGCKNDPYIRVNNLTWKSPPKMSIDVKDVYYAHFITTAGDFVVKLNTKLAPVTVNNFVFLSRRGFYHCVSFQRVIPGFVVQGGDPTGSGSGGPGYTFKDELPPVGSPTYPLYSVAMANNELPNTNGSQFFFVIGASGESLPAKYSLFGQVISGERVVAKIGSEGSAGGTPLVVQRMLSITINNVS
jgi:cyclophilin family peptidyl-prolyl cis-trans isomerase